MKRILLFISLSGSLFGNGTTYYSQGSFDPGQLTSWGSLLIGGIAPSSFTNAGDVFVIQAGHNMTTTAAWVVGAAGSILQIQSGGTLTGNNSIILTGTFRIDNGGKYIHNNNNPIASTPNTSIWSGAESFAANSTVEIQNWINDLAMIPSGIAWGNLVINLTHDLGGSWNQAGNITNVQGNLQIISSGIASGEEFRITGNTNTVLTIGGDIIIDGGILNIKTTNTAGTSCIVQVNGNVSVNNNGTLNVGTADAVLNAELRFKGNFNASTAATVTSMDNNSYLVANGSTVQVLNCAPTLGCNFRIAPTAIVTLSASLTTGSSKIFAVLGTFDDNNFSKTFSGPLEVAGGAFSTTAALAMGLNRCRSCTGNGTYAGPSETWCTTTGSKGRINFNSNSITFNQHPASMIFAGSGSSPGDIYLTNTATIGFTGVNSGTGSIFLNTGSVLSLDANSHIYGNANFSIQGGTLRIGSIDGITSTGNTTNGNIRVSGTKAYNSSGANNFEYFGTSPQVTGDGLPITITGTLKINNTAGIGTSGVTLSQATTVSDELDLRSGKLTTSLANLLTLSDTGTVNLPVAGASYVNGPMKKIGSASFSFPIGKGNSYAPLALTGTGVATDEYIAEYFTGNPRVAIGFPYADPPINHMSVLEWWTVDRHAGTSAREVTLEATTYSDATLLSDLRILRWDGSIWQDEGNTAFAGVSTGPVTSNVIADFFVAGTATPFTFGSVTSFENPLPITLISFDATKLSGGKLSVNWELAAPCPPEVRFEIQRAETSRSFATIAAIHGNSNSRFYHYTDNGLKNGAASYRLKIVDEDGRIVYSHIAVVMDKPKSLLLTLLSSTVISNTATLTIVSSVRQRFVLVVTDMLGRIVKKLEYKVEPGNTSIEINFSGLAAGMYQMAGFGTEEKTNSMMFIKE